ncbi:hypothetical protein TcBrA4_0002850 [Trypanosoma cruzi]|nr:hypothetical protein TcBrA4_0002850 [Trypanosoma cruzi]
MRVSCSTPFAPFRTTRKPSPSPKPIIKLSVGDPTLDKNLLTSAAQIKKLKEAIDSQECNGYFPTVGSPEAAKLSRHGGATRLSTRKS